MSAEDSLGWQWHHWLWTAGVWGDRSFWLSCCLKAAISPSVSTAGLLVILLQCLPVLEEACPVIGIWWSCLELVWCYFWLISSVRGEGFNNRFWRLVLCTIIDNFYLWTLGFCKNSLHGSEFISYCVVSIAVIFFDSYISGEEKNGIRYEKLLCSLELLEKIFEALLWNL